MWKPYTSSFVIIRSGHIKSKLLDRSAKSDTKNNPTFLLIFNVSITGTNNIVNYNPCVNKLVFSEKIFSEFGLWREFLNYEYYTSNSETESIMAEVRMAHYVG